MFEAVAASREKDTRQTNLTEKNWFQEQRARHHLRVNTVGRNYVGVGVRIHSDERETRCSAVKSAVEVPGREGSRNSKFVAECYLDGAH